MIRNTSFDDPFLVLPHYIFFDMSNLMNEFGTAVSNADFLSNDWLPEHCDPTKWDAPSTHGIDGVELVGDPGMKFWSDTKAWSNPGRVNFKIVDQQHLADSIATQGIIPSRVVYFDVDTDETINGMHRRAASIILGIPAWMHQGVRFENELARVRFANASNWTTNLYSKDPSIDDVKAGVCHALTLVGAYDKKGITYEVRTHGPGLTNKQASTLVNKIYSLCMFDTTLELEGRYRELNNETIMPLINRIREDHSDIEPWVRDYYDNPDAIVIIVNGKNFESRVGAILSKSSQAMLADKPLHVIFAVPIPEAKESLACKRNKFFTLNFDNLENRLLDMQGKSHTDKNRREFPWNHADCQHRTVAQDTINEEDIPLIKVVNRNFN